MGIRDADHLPFVLEDQNVSHFGPRSQLAELHLPGGEQSCNLRDVEFGQRHVVPRAVADDSRNALGRTMAIDPRRRFEVQGRRRSDARMIVVEDKDTGIRIVSHAARTDIAGAEWAIVHIGRHDLRVTSDRLPHPGSLIPVCSDDYPFLTQRMPALFPGHGAIVTATRE